MNRPAIVGALRGYDALKFRSDFLAGVTVGLVALPLALAFGIASGVTPQAGLITAIAGGFIVAILGGSRTQIAGPTGAFVVIVSGIVAKHGMPGLLVVTTMAGIILIVLGLTGLGSAIAFIPRPVIIGFTNGIAVLIVSTQLKDFLGLRYGPAATDFATRMQAVAHHLTTVDAATTCVAAVTLVLALVVPRVWPRIPGAIVALVCATACVRAFHIDVATIGSRFGSLSGILHFVTPHVSFGLAVALLPSALTVALLAAVESLLSAVVADSLTGDRHDANVELVGTGIANVIVPLLGGIPVTGAIARTATSIRSGGRTPVAAIVHSLTLAAIVFIATPLATAVPIAALAAILMVVAYNMGEWRQIGTIVRLDNPSRAVWFTTFFLTVVADLTVAVGTGITLAALLYIYRVSRTTTVSHITSEDIEDGKPHVLFDKIIPPFVSIIRIHGPFLFGATDALADATRDLSAYGSIVILRLRNMTAIDATGLHAIVTFRNRLAQSGRTLLLCGARDQPADLLYRSDFMRALGRDNILANVRDALDRARTLHAAVGARR